MRNRKKFLPGSVRGIFFIMSWQTGTLTAEPQKIYTDSFYANNKMSKHAPGGSPLSTLTGWSRRDFGGAVKSVKRYGRQRPLTLPAHGPLATFLWASGLLPGRFKPTGKVRPLVDPSHSFFIPTSTTAISNGTFYRSSGTVLDERRRPIT